MVREYSRRSETGGFECLICGQVVKYKSGMKRHLEEQHINCGIPNICPICQRSYKTKSSLYDHMKTLHRDGMADTCQ